ncbi:hypothetical protein HanIR_Chr17g0858381 [Helianthus annuus]|nr:hypothetical protein HanIR_Chr17g0858381 [Helianthus annuus]
MSYILNLNLKQISKSITGYLYIYLKITVYQTVAFLTYYSYSFINIKSCKLLILH